MADRLGRNERAVDMHAVDNRIDAQDLDAIRFWFDDGGIVADADEEPVGGGGQALLNARDQIALGVVGDRGTRAPGCQDRKSTRLNSSHSQISYAVFCLKKKT